jgi:sarcosine oxidase subunit alpha
MRRLADRGRIDHDRSFTFTYDGRPIEAHPGDTVASALLANDVRVLGSSVLMSRPRGVVTDGVSDPHAFVQVGSGATTEPLMRATQVEAHAGLVVESRLHQGVLPRSVTRTAMSSSPAVVLLASARRSPPPTPARA